MYRRLVPSNGSLRRPSLARVKERGSQLRHGPRAGVVPNVFWGMYLYLTITRTDMFDFES